MTAPTRPFASVWFDCDSTLSAIEGIDELMAGISARERQEIKALTHQAMEGAIPLERVYEQRLQRMAPSASDLLRIAEEYWRHVTPGAVDTVATLRQLGKRVGVVSGGLQQPVQRFAERCSIDPQHVHAVPVILDDNGSYVDFDRSGPMWRSGGKAEFFRTLPTDLLPAAHIGDGATDLEAVGVLDLFLGFGGVVERPVVRAGCHHFIGENDLTAALPYLLTPGEWEQAAGDNRLPPSLLQRRRPT